MKHKLLLSILVFNAVTALAGGLMLLLRVNAPPQSWLDHTVFSSYTVPGLLLLLLVGGSALLAIVSDFVMDAKLGSLSVVSSGLILLGWIIGELAIIRHYSWLQLLYLLSAVLVVTLAYGERRTYGQN